MKRICKDAAEASGGFLWFGSKVGSEEKRVLDRIAAGDRVTLDAAAIDAMAEAYAAHIAREEGELLPMAARLLGDAELQRIGASMRARRAIAST